jgi:hypothetical protein
MEKNKNTQVLVIAVLSFAILFMSVGFATYASTLNINGTSTINVPGWDVHFANVNVSSGSVNATTTPSIASDGLSINYAVSLNEPGQYYEFTVQIVNNGTMDAELSAAPVLSGVSTAQDVYTNYTLVYADNNTVPRAGDLVRAGNSRTIKVRVMFDNVSADQLPTTSQVLNLSASMEYVQA